jgi:hypothetical protein
MFRPTKPDYSRVDLALIGQTAVLGAPTDAGQWEQGYLLKQELNTDLFVTTRAWNTAGVRRALDRPDIIDEIYTPPVNTKDSNGYTALTRACEDGCLDIVADLIRRGADPNIRGYDGETALTRACWSVYPDLPNQVGERLESLTRARAHARTQPTTGHTLTTGART